VRRELPGALATAEKMVFDLLNPHTWRYERKFIVSELDKYEIESLVKLHPALFSEIHHERTVNNIYFDSIAMTNYLDNLGGKSQRVKVRIRWYGGLLGAINKPVLEIKTKKGHVGAKISFPLEPLAINESLTIDTMREILKKAEIPDALKVRLLDLKFSLLNCYRRKYFQSADKKFRITIDSDLRFLRLSPMGNTFSQMVIDHTNTILELKYGKEFDDYADRITNYFPFRMTKSSKYVAGVELLNT
jgi:SPX domain protein involved in polyphosphate accumulation